MTVSYQDVAGARQTLALDGLAARIFQHEFDHLQGTLFHDRMDAAALAAVRPQLDALETAWATREAAGAGGARPARARR